MIRDNKAIMIEETNHIRKDHGTDAAVKDVNNLLLKDIEAEIQFFNESEKSFAC